ncbi:hypothetical protein GGI07_002137 [Coemansia sp. Benny D115]|nr:hypothetical protein GGI07_002137 [Coemansia sp. Benny D115]
MFSLYTWGSPFENEGVYSFDPACVSVQAYMQLCKAEWRLNQVKNSAISPNGCLPAITCKGSMIESGLWNIVNFLKSEGYDLNLSLTDEQQSQTTAYVSLVQDCLADAILFSWYLVSENFADVIRPRLARLFGFPLSFFAPTQLKDYAEERLGFRGIGKEIDEKSSEKSSADSSSSSTSKSFASKIPRIYLLAKGGFVKHADKSAHPVYKQANMCLEALSKKLGQNEYFFGDKPTMLDAVVYGYLSLIIYPELPQNTLKNITTSKYPNLLNLCHRIHCQMAKPEMAQRQSWYVDIGTALKQGISSYLSPLQGLSSGSGKNGSSVDEAETEVSNEESLRYTELLMSAVGAFSLLIGYIIYNRPSAVLPEEVKLDQTEATVVSDLGEMPFVVD